MEKKSIGKVTVGFGSKDQREIEVVNFVRSSFKDHRLITISELEDGSIISVVENPESSGRASQAKIWLSKQSFLGLIATSYLYFMKKGEDFEGLLKDVLVKDELEYEFASIDEQEKNK